MASASGHVVVANMQSFATQTDANKLTFDPRPARRLRDVLDADERDVQVLEGLVRLEPAQRLRAEDSLALLPPAPEAAGVARPILEPWIQSAETRFAKLM